MPSCQVQCSGAPAPACVGRSAQTPRPQRCRLPCLPACPGAARRCAARAHRPPDWRPGCELHPSVPQEGVAAAAAVPACLPCAAASWLPLDFGACQLHGGMLPIRGKEGAGERLTALRKGNPTSGSQDASPQAAAMQAVHHLATHCGRREGLHVHGAASCAGEANRSRDKCGVDSSSAKGGRAIVAWWS